MAVISGVVAALSLTSTGCIGLKAGPALGIFSIPVPVSPYFQKMQEDKFWNHERYERAPILGPIIPGGPMVALDPPTGSPVPTDACCAFPAIRSCTSGSGTMFAS